MCSVELIWRWMTLELLKSEAPAYHLLYSLARSCRDRFNPHLPSAISARLKTEKSVLQKMASPYHKTQPVHASRCRKIPHPDQGATGRIQAWSMMTPHRPISTELWVQWLSFSLMRECDDAWCITSRVMVQSLSALCLRACKSARALCIWWPF